MREVTFLESGFHKIYGNFEYSLKVEICLL